MVVGVQALEQSAPVKLVTEARSAEKRLSDGERLPWQRFKLSAMVQADDGRCSIV